MISRALRCLLELRGHSGSKPKVTKQPRRLNLEPLEDRLLLTLVGIEPNFPLTFFDSTGHFQYTPLLIRWI